MLTLDFTTAQAGATEHYSALRCRLLIGLTRSMGDGDHQFEESTHVLNLMIGIYDQPARDAAMHRNRQ